MNLRLLRPARTKYLGAGGAAVLVVLLFFMPPASLSSYSFQYENLLLLNMWAGFGNLAFDDAAAVPDNFAFSAQIALARYALMPRGDVNVTLVLRNNYLLRFQVLLDNLRHQQSNISFGLGSETNGVLLGLAQEYTLASGSRPRRLGLGLYTKLFYNLQGVMDLLLESTVLTNTLDNGNTDGYRNIYLHLRALFMLWQLRLGVTATLHFFEAVATGPAAIQLQSNLVFGGSAPTNSFLLDLYLANVVLINRGRTDNNYSLIFFGMGLKLQLTMWRRTVFGLFFEAFPFGIGIHNVESIAKNKPAFTFGFSLDLRFSRKQLWSPEVIDR